MAIRRITSITPVISLPQKPQLIKKRAASTPLDVKPKPRVVHPIKDFDRFITFYPRKEIMRQDEFLRDWLLPYMNVNFSYGRWTLKVYPVTKDHFMGGTEVIGLTVFFHIPGKPLTNCPKLFLTNDKHLWGHKIVQFAINRNVVASI